jgi:hypothetical protein
VNTPVRAWSRDPLKRLLFEVGAGYYARKLATGPEADLRPRISTFLAVAGFRQWSRHDQSPGRWLRARSCGSSARSFWIRCNRGGPQPQPAANCKKTRDA